METGIEPVCTVLQTVASPLGHSTVALPPQARGTGADDETRTRDPHLGKVMRYQLRYIRIALTRTRGAPPLCVDKLYPARGVETNRLLGR